MDERTFAENELTEEGKTYREALIPAGKLNAALKTARILSDDEIDELTMKRTDSFWARKPYGQRPPWLR
ncbi:MAG: hypothetical protein ACYDA3_14825 [Gaiellaceae bacterium]